MMRNLDIAVRFVFNNEPLVDLAADYGISRQRVSQILTKALDRPVERRFRWSEALPRCHGV